MIRSSFQQFAKIIKILNFGNFKKINADTYSEKLHFILMDLVCRLTIILLHFSSLWYLKFYGQSYEIQSYKNRLKCFCDKKQLSECFLQIRIEKSQNGVIRVTFTAHRKGNFGVWFRRKTGKLTQKRIKRRPRRRTVCCTHAYQNGISDVNFVINR